MYVTRSFDDRYHCSGGMCCILHLYKRKENGEMAETGYSKTLGLI